MRPPRETGGEGSGERSDGGAFSYRSAFGPQPAIQRVVSLPAEPIPRFRPPHDSQSQPRESGEPPISPAMLASASDAVAIYRTLLETIETIAATKSPERSVEASSIVIVPDRAGDATAMLDSIEQALSQFEYEVVYRATVRIGSPVAGQVVIPRAGADVDPIGLLGAAVQALTAIADNGIVLVDQSYVEKRRGELAPGRLTESQVATLLSQPELLFSLQKLVDRTRAGSRAHHLCSRCHSAPDGQKVFIGHGHSDDWKVLAKYLTHLGMGWSEFNSDSAAGRQVTERLSEMLMESSMAFLVMTAEDRQADHTLRARENVVHEAGLFQGHLGFHRAIVLRASTCEGFSNNAGLQPIKFDPGRIGDSLGAVKLVLQREHLVVPSRSE